MCHILNLVFKFAHYTPVSSVRALPRRHSEASAGGAVSRAVVQYQQRRPAPSSGAVCRAVRAASSSSRRQGRSVVQYKQHCPAGATLVHFAGPLCAACVCALCLLCVLSAPHVPCVLHVMKVVIRHNHANTVVLRLCSALARPQHLRSLHALREASSECHCVL